MRTLLRNCELLDSNLYFCCCYANVIFYAKRKKLCVILFVKSFHNIFSILHETSTDPAYNF